MPDTSINITREKLGKKQKNALFASATQLLANGLSKHPLISDVVVNEIGTANWGIGGASITVQRWDDK